MVPGLKVALKNYPNRRPGESLIVIPVNPGSRSRTGSGIQRYMGLLDSGFRRNDENRPE
ncbi:MAG: hypothetical protein R6V20_01565 [Desulfobia sp.]